MDADRKPLMAGRRIMARSLTYEGRRYAQHVAEIDPEGRVTISPFITEGHSTLYAPQAVEVKAVQRADGWMLEAYAE